MNSERLPVFSDTPEKPIPIGKEPRRALVVRQYGEVYIVNSGTDTVR
jgi:hypothetical protein